MKKIIVTLIAAMMSFNAAAYDGPFGFEKNNNHHIGFGVSTNLFGGSQLLGGLAYNATNGFDTKINTNNIVYLKSQTSFGVFAEYHYNFSQWNAVATHIKWNYKELNYGMTGGNTGENYADLGDKSYFHNIEVPIMLRHTFHKGDIALFTGIIGVGADITLSSQLMSFATYSQNTFPKYDGGRIELTEKRKVNPFINLGLAFSHSLSNNHKLEASLMLNFYPLMNNYKYEYNNPNGYNGVYNDNSKSFDNHSLTVSIAYYL